MESQYWPSARGMYHQLAKETLLLNKLGSHSHLHNKSPTSPGFAALVGFTPPHHCALPTNNPRLDPLASQTISRPLGPLALLEIPMRMIPSWYVFMFRAINQQVLTIHVDISPQ